MAWRMADSVVANGLVCGTWRAEIRGAAKAGDAPRQNGQQRLTQDASDGAESRGCALGIYDLTTSAFSKGCAVLLIVVADGDRQGIHARLTAKARCIDTVGCQTLKSDPAQHRID